MCRRGSLASSEDQPNLVAELDRVARALGGATWVWRFDRMATACDPGSGRVTASFAGVVEHYGMPTAICPPRCGGRKGVVEKVNYTAAQRWWRTLPDDVTVEETQARLDRFANARGYTRSNIGKVSLDFPTSTRTNQLIKGIAVPPVRGRETCGR